MQLGHIFCLSRGFVFIQNSGVAYADFLKVRIQLLLPKLKRARVACDILSSSNFAPSYAVNGTYRACYSEVLPPCLAMFS